MPRYFFHEADGHVAPDKTGTELLDTAAARTEAIRFAGAVLADQPDLLDGNQHFRVEVADTGGRLLFTVVVLTITPAMPGS